VCTAGSSLHQGRIGASCANWQRWRLLCLSAGLGLAGAVVIHVQHCPCVTRRRVKVATARGCAPHPGVAACLLPHEGVWLRGGHRVSWCACLSVFATSGLGDGGRPLLR
jgi:hypothetical protein